MTADRRKSSQEFGQESANGCAQPVDFVFLKSQTFADTTLERELLQLFVAQARRLIREMAAMDDKRQSEAAHLLKGSALSIGARTVAQLAQDLCDTGAKGRAPVLATLARAVDNANDAISAHLETL